MLPTFYDGLVRPVRESATLPRSVVLPTPYICMRLLPICVWLSAAFLFTGPDARAQGSQNLLTPAGWVKGPQNPGFVQAFSSTPSQLSFSPQSNPSQQWCAVSQTVDVPKPGHYQLEVSGSTGFGSSGSFSYEIQVGAHALLKQVQEGQMAFARTVFLTRGKHLVQFRSTTTSLGFNLDTWVLNPPSLTAALLPEVQINASWGGFEQDSRLFLSADANFLAVSLFRGNPIPIPGFSHGLELGLSTMAVVAVSGTGKISLFLSPGISRWPGYVWPRVYLQAATVTRFGSAVLLR